MNQPLTPEAAPKKGMSTFVKVLLGCGVLLLLGIGWNFLYIGGTTLLTEAYAPAEKAKTQGLNDFLMFFAMAGSSFFSGVLVTSAGWTVLNQIAIPFVALSVFATSLLWLKRRRAA